MLYPVDEVGRGGTVGRIDAPVCVQEMPVRREDEISPELQHVFPLRTAVWTPAGEDDILDEEVTDEDLEDLELYNPDDYLDEEMETDDFPDPAEHNLDEIQQKDEELNGEFEAEDATLTRRRRNTGNIGVLDINFE